MNVAVFPREDGAFTSVCYLMLYYCDHHVRISLINHPRHMASYAGRFKGLFRVWSQLTDLSAVVWKQNQSVCPTEMLIN